MWITIEIRELLSLQDRSIVRSLLITSRVVEKLWNFIEDEMVH